MGRIPTYQDQVQIGALPGVRARGGATPASFGGQEAAMLGQVGRTVQQVGQQLLAREQQEAAKERKVEADRAMIQYQTDRGKLRSDYEQRKGVDAAGAEKDFEKDLVSLRRSIGSGLSSPEVQERFDLLASSTVPGDLNNMRGHVIQQTEIANTANRQAQNKLAVDEMNHDPFDDKLFQEAVFVNGTNLDVELRKVGITGEAAKDARQQVFSQQSQLRVNALLKTVTMDDPEGVAAAEAHLEKYKNIIDATTMKVLKDTVKLARVAVDSHKRAQRLMGQEQLTDSERLRSLAVEVDVDDLSEEEEAATRNELLRLMRIRDVEKKAYDAEQHTAFNNAMIAMINPETGSFPSRASVDLQLSKVDLSPEDALAARSGWDKMIALRQKGQYETEVKGQYQIMRLIADERPNAFLDVDLAKRGHLYKWEDWQKLRALQNKIRNGETDSPRDRTFREVRASLKAGVELRYPLLTGKDITAEKQSVKERERDAALYDMERFVEARFELDAAHIGKLVSPADRQKYTNQVIDEAFKKYTTAKSFWGDTEEEKFRLQSALGENPEAVVEETAAAREALEERTGVPVDALRNRDGTVSVIDLAAIDTIIRKQGEVALPRVRADGSRLIGLRVQVALPSRPGDDPGQLGKAARQVGRVVATKAQYSAPTREHPAIRPGAVRRLSDYPTVTATEFRRRQERRGYLKDLDAAYAKSQAAMDKVLKDTAAGKGE